MPIINPNSISREEYLKKKRKRKFFRYSIFFVFIILVFSLLSYGSHRKEFRINDVTLSGGVLVTEKDVKDESLEYLRGSYFWLFPKNNAFIYSKTNLEKDLMEKFKRIETIDISLEGLNKMNIKITERKPIAIWCRKNLNNKTEENSSTTIKVANEKEECFFIDLNSVIFAVAPNFSGDAYFKYYGLVDKDNPIGEKYISSSTEFMMINGFVEEVKKLSIKPLFLKAKGEGEFSLYLYGGGEVYFDVKKSLELTYNNLETLLNSKELSFKQGVLPVEYIDLRYGNKLFYKLKIN